MTKSEFIKAVAEKAETTQKATREFLDAMQEVVYEEMANGGEVKIMDAITLLAKEVPERTARNPQSGEEIVVPPHLAPKAKFGKGIKDYLKEA